MYLVVDGVRCDESVSGVDLPYRNIRVDVGFSFSEFDESLNLDYDVQIVAVAENTFDFTVDGFVYSYGLLGDLTDCFVIDKRGGYFTIDLRTDIFTVLSAYFDSADVDLSGLDFYGIDLFRLIVTSGDAFISVDFSILDSVLFIHFHNAYYSESLSDWSFSYSSQAVFGVVILEQGKYSTVAYYDVLIVPVFENSFDFLVDGVLHSFGDIEDLTLEFLMYKYEDHFRLYISSVVDVLSSYFDGASIDIEGIPLPGGGYSPISLENLFRLSVSFDGQLIDIDFGIPLYSGILV
jgi:hypothetical protein